MSQDILMPMVGAVAGLVAGFFLVLKMEQKWGWLIVAAAAVYAFYTIQPVIQSARTGQGSQPAGGYYRRP